MKIRNYFFSSCAAITAMALGVCIVSCSDDDDDNGGSASTFAGVLDKESGLRVKSVDNYVYYYDDNGRIDSVCDFDSIRNSGLVSDLADVNRYVFKYKPNRIISFYDGKEDGVYTVGYNNSGYLTRLSGSWSESWDDSSASGNIQYTMTYNAVGRLTKVSESGMQSGIENGERYNDKWKGTTTLIWSSNKLMRIVSSTDYGDEEPDTHMWVFSYDDDNYKNVYCQWTPSLTDGFGEAMRLLFYAGVMGVGPTMLPTSVEEVDRYYYDGELFTSNYSYTYRYGFNDNGSLSYCTTIEDNEYEWRCYFKYDYAGDNSGKGTRSEVSRLPASGKKHAHRFGRMLKR